MKKGDIGFAYFVRSPRRKQDLLRPHWPEEEQAYRVVKEVSLSSIGYENFVEDMTVDRMFLKDVPEAAAGEECLPCAFVHRMGYADGVLAVPVDGCFVGLAAYVMDQRDKKEQRPR